MWFIAKASCACSQVISRVQDPYSSILPGQTCNFLEGRSRSPDSFNKPVISHALYYQIHDLHIPEELKLLCLLSFPSQLSQSRSPPPADGVGDLKRGSACNDSPKEVPEEDLTKDMPQGQGPESSETDGSSPFEEDWASDEEYSTSHGDFPKLAVTSHIFTKVPDPAENAKSFLEDGLSPVASPARPFVFYENVARAAPSEAESAAIWGVKSHELFGIEREVVDSATVSVSHRLRGYISNVPKNERRRQILSPYLTIQDLFPSRIRYWPDWDSRKKSGKLHTICTKFPHNREIKRVNAEAKKAASTGGKPEEDQMRIVSQAISTFQ